MILYLPRYLLLRALCSLYYVLVDGRHRFHIRRVISFIQFAK